MEPVLSLYRAMPLQDANVALRHPFQAGLELGDAKVIDEADARLWPVQSGDCNSTGSLAGLAGAVARAGRCGWAVIDGMRLERWQSRRISLRARSAHQRVD